MQIPLLKDGVVVNVVELEDETLRVSKAEYRQIAMEDEAEHAKKVDAWRLEMGKLRETLTAAEMGLAAARKAAADVKAQAKVSKGSAKAALERVLSADNEVIAWEENVRAAYGLPHPAKPKFVRRRAWIIPEGFTLGEPGGNIGDTWDGKAYLPPAEKAA